MDCVAFGFGAASDAAGRAVCSMHAGRFDEAACSAARLAATYVKREPGSSTGGGVAAYAFAAATDDDSFWLALPADYFDAEDAAAA